MLIEFSLSNYGSFAAEQTLSLIASKLKDQTPGRVLRVDPPHNLEVLNSAIILGKNGSGKSTLVGAMSWVRRFVRTSSSSSQEGEEIPFTPNLLDSSLKGRDTHVRVLFSVNDKIFQYQFSFNRQRITGESLSAADRTVRFRRIYERLLDPDSEEEEYSFSDDLKGEKALWRSSTRQNALFLSTAVQLNAEALREPFEWLTKYLRAIDAANISYADYTAGQCLDEEHKKRILKFLKRLDIDIEDIVVEEEDVSEELLRGTFTPEFIQNMPTSRKKRRRVKFIHHDTDGLPVPLDLSDESSGTNALFGLAGPIFDTLANGYCLIIDEINTSLHPLILKTLVEAFSDPQLNKRRAQLIFTSHDTSLLRDSYFRRDQIWFVEKDRFGRSELVPLSDYSPRKGEALEKGYLGGRYGGVPAIGQAIEDLPSAELADAH
ncbi:MAG TPA: ATP-binding protein [Sphingomicrobium sp.]|nr:ATP-binding protein [Sphingomicrobium sp.]